MTLLPREWDGVEIPHECDWCRQDRNCAPARAGSGTLWICGDCEFAALDFKFPAADSAESGQETP